MNDYCVGFADDLKYNYKQHYSCALVINYI